MNFRARNGEIQQINYFFYPLTAISVPMLLPPPNDECQRMANGGRRDQLPAKDY